MSQNAMLEDVFRALDQYFTSYNGNIIIGLTIGMELETKGRRFYEEAYDQSKRDLFLFLAEEELKHLRALEAVKAIIERNGQWGEVRAVQVKLFGRPKLFQGRQTEPRISLESTHRNVLLAARSVEQKSEDFYRRLVDKVKDENAQTFFTALAGFEHQHLEKIQVLLPPASEGGVINRLREGVRHKHKSKRR